MHQQADLLLAGGRVWIGGRSIPAAAAVADGRILAIGSPRELTALQGAGTQCIDVAGGTILPGFTDAHIHLLWYGLQQRQLDLSGCRTPAAVLQTVAERAQSLPAAAWVLGRGWDDERLGGWRPGRGELDRAAPGRPVLLRRVCGHVAAVNSLALQCAGLGCDPPGGAIDRDGAGQPTGIVRETAVEAVAAAAPQPTAAELRAALKLAARQALALGITAVHTEDARSAGGGLACLQLYQDVLGPELPLRAYLHIHHPYMSELQELGLSTGAGDAWVRVGAVKLFADGSLGGRTAALGRPYADDPSTCGLLIQPPAELARLVRQSHADGWQVAIHAIGDAAMSTALDAVAAAQAAGPATPRRHRIIHCQALTADLARRMAALGVIADIQPVFVVSDGAWFARRLGPERLNHAYGWRTLLQEGVVCCGGSDCPIEPMNPLLGVAAAVHRQGAPAPTAQRLSVAEAIDLFTTGAAFAAFDEQEGGVIASGRRADLVVLDADPAAVDPTELAGIGVRLTLVNGRVAYTGS